MALAVIPQSDPHRALMEAYNDVTCETSYITELAELLSKEASSSDSTPTRIEALASAIGLMAGTVEKKLEQHALAHKKVSGETGVPQHPGSPDHNVQT